LCQRLIDSHCHLDAPAFAHDRAAVLARARAAEVIAQVVPAVTAAGWATLRKVCLSAPHLFPAYGLPVMGMSCTTLEEMNGYNSRFPTFTVRAPCPRNTSTP